MISVFLSQHLPLDLTQNHSGALLRTNRSLRVRRRTQIAAMGSPGSLLSRATAPEVNNAVGKHVQKYAQQQRNPFLVSSVFVPWCGVLGLP